MSPHVSSSVEVTDHVTALQLSFVVAAGAGTSSPHSKVTSAAGVTVGAVVSSIVIV